MLRKQKRMVATEVAFLIFSLIGLPDEVICVSGEDFQAGAHDSVLNVLSLTANDPLNSFIEIWYSVFLWSLFSSLAVHVGACLIAICRLRQHRIGRWIPIGIVAMGIISPLTGGAISSAAIAGVYRASDFHMHPYYALVWGIGQTVAVIIISFSRILATL